VAGGRTVRLRVAGTAGVPVGAGAVALNVTVTGSTRGGYVAVAPARTPATGTSTLNYPAGGTIANLALVGLSSDGFVDLTVAGGATQLIADVTGYAVRGTPAADGAFGAVPPVRALDTRATGDPLTTGQRTAVKVTALGAVPATGVAAVALNLTATRVTLPTTVVAVAGGAGLPGTSNLNVGTGATTANLVLAPVSASGTVDLAVLAGRADLVVDVTGYVLGPPADTTPPGAVTRLTAVPSADRVTLAWTDPSATDLSAVVIRRSVGPVAPASPTAGTAVATVAPGTGTYSDLAVMPGALYSYALFAQDTTPNYSPAAATTATVLEQSWGPAALVDPSRGAPADISCPTATWCLAVDRSGQALTYDGTTWSAPSLVQPIGDGTAGFTAVSCPTTQFCFAIGSGFTARLTAGTWTVTPSTTAWSAVSCSSPTQCLLLRDVEGANFSWHSVVASWDGATIGPERTLDDVQLGSVSCPSALACFVAGNRVTALGMAVYDVTATSATETALPATGYSAPTDISCPSTTSCLAAAGSSAWQMSGTTWNSLPPIVSSGGLTMRAVDVSCSSASSCAVTGGSMVARWDGAAWRFHTLTTAIVTTTGTACPASTMCVVADTTGHAYRWNGSAWSDRQVFDVTSGGLHDLSCSTPTWCLATDEAGMVLSWNGSTWSSPQPLLESATDVDCVPGGWCMAVDTVQGTYRVYSSGHWSATSTMPKPGPTSGLTCSTSQLCFTADENDVRQWNGSTWTAALPGPSVMGGGIVVECVPSSSCLLAEPGRSYVYSNGAWGHVASAPFPRVNWLSCATPSWCMVDANANYSVFDGTSWSAARTDQDRVPGTCVPESGCTSYSQADRHLWRWSGNWRDTGTVLPLIPRLTECPTPRWCVAVDNQSATHTL